MTNPGNRVERFRGIIPAVVSPHDGQDNFSVEAFARQIAFLYEQGVHGVYTCGGTGEGYCMRLEERKNALEVAAELSKSRGVLIDHVGAQCTRDAAELAEHAARWRADAIASLPPPRRTQKELLAYYSALSQASGLPVFVYYMPAITGKSMGYDELLELLDVDGVVGMKFTDSNLFLMRRLLDARPGIVIFSGFDEMLLPAMQYGATGGIGTWYNVVPRAFLAIFEAASRGDYKTAWEWQRRVIKLTEFGWGYGIEGTVELLLRQQGRVLHAFRRPCVPFDAAFIAETALTLSQILTELESTDRTNHHPPGSCIDKVG